MKTGDRVKIMDGSYVERVDKYEEDTYIKPYNDTFVIIALRYTNLFSGTGAKIHDVIIKNAKTGKTYLHSLKFIRPETEEEKEEEDMRAVPEGSPIFVYKNDRLIGMLLHDPKGWIIRTGGIFGACGYSRTRKRAMKKGRDRLGYTFSIH